MVNTTYALRFLQSAKKEWEKLDSTIKHQFQKKLAERLNEPRIPSAALFNMPDCYKIKLRKAGYRLVYRVENEIVTVTVIAVGKRDKSEVYRDAKDRQ
jgi:addiction module toxin, RelE/StbE family